MINTASIYELTVLYCDSPVTYPKPVEREPLGFFTNIERAEEFLRSGVEKGQVGWFEIEADYVVLGYQLAEWMLDGARTLRWQRHYAPDGHGRGDEPMDEEPQPWAGRPPETCRFKVGDIVQLVAYDNLEVGKVAALPLSPQQVAEINARSHFAGIPVDQFEDRYFIWLGAGEHAHAVEGELCAPLAKVEESLAQALQARLATSSE